MRRFIDATETCESATLTVGRAALALFTMMWFVLVAHPAFGSPLHELWDKYPEMQTLDPGPSYQPAEEDLMAEYSCDRAAKAFMAETKTAESKLTALLTTEREADAGFPVNSLIMVLKPDQATFFINGHSIGRTVGVEVRVKFEVDSDRRIDLAVGRVKLGALPGIPFSKQLADLVFESTALDDKFEQALPEGVRDVSIEEGRIVILLDSTR